MSLLQTLATAFKGGGGGRVPLARNFSSPWYFGGADGARAPFDYGRAVRQAYLDNPVAQRAVRLVAEGIGGAPLLPTDPELAALVGATSAGQSLLETVASHLSLHGNAYVQIMTDARGRPVELFALRPERVTIEPGADGWPAAYVYRVGRPHRDASRCSPPTPRPTSSTSATCTRSTTITALGCLGAAGRRSRSTMPRRTGTRRCSTMPRGRRARWSTIPATGASLTAEQFDRLKAEMEASFSGAGNAGRPMLLEGGLRWQALSLTPRRHGFRRRSRRRPRARSRWRSGCRRCCSGCRAKSTYANYKEANARCGG